MSSLEVFLSHKAKDGPLAKQVQQALCSLFPDIEIFLSEEIPKSEDFRENIWATLEKARFFILLYTDPSDDWSWCFFEVGAYRSVWRGESRTRHPIYCLHPREARPPGPLSNLQTIKAEVKDIERWIEDVRKLLKRKAPPIKKVQLAVAQIEEAVKARSILDERTIKPHIWITPRWPNEKPVNFNAAKLPEIPLENAIVTIDPESATKLGFCSVPDGLELLQFLQMLDCDGGDVSPERPYWIIRFFSSLTKALNGNLLLQEVAYFRHEGGSILRPIVVSVSKSRDGTLCKLKVLFIQTFSAPLTDHPSSVQRLADGVRLGVRTRIEVINGFSGQLSRIFREKIRSEPRGDLIARKYPVGRRVIEALETITEEARAHGIRPQDTPPSLFSDPSDQAVYEQVRAESVRIWQRLKVMADLEDKDGAGKYTGTEKLLTEMKALNDRYLRLALPRLNALLVATPGVQGGRQIRRKPPEPNNRSTSAVGTS
jgi:TIR domain